MQKQKSQTSRVELVPIAIDSADKIREFSANYKINCPVLVGDAGTIGLLGRLGNHAGVLPYTLALEVNGAIRQRHLGTLTESGPRQVITLERLKCCVRRRSTAKKRGSAWTCANSRN